MSFDSLVQIFLIGASLALGGYCLLLARRLRKLNDLESGLGGAIAILSAEIERLEGAIGQAQAAATRASLNLSSQIEEARRERGLWDLHKQVSQADTGPQVRPSLRRLRKREDLHHV
jgi:hypothetical protein